MSRVNILVRPVRIIERRRSEFVVVAVFFVVGVGGGVVLLGVAR